jgi:UDP-N-acetylmuramoyl-L-alanyl-D-glutamate--2,6-diaminopimelate ligase
MRLADLASAVDGARVVQGDAVAVHRVVYDSRRAQPGDLFVAIPGELHDGATFAQDALNRGAVAVAAEREIDVPTAAGLLLVPSTRRALGDLANVLYGSPSEHLRVIGVTGTDGKTTTSQLIAHVLAAAGRRVGWMTTIDVRIGDEHIPNPFGHTTPEASDVHDLLARMVANGVEDVVLEVSSHALALDRVRGVTFDVAVFTNLAAEHLNFHGTMEAYAEAKAELFAMLDSPTEKTHLRFGVVNADDAASTTMVTASPAGIVSYAVTYPADVRAVDLELSLDRTRFTLATPIDELEIETRFVGRHNVYNWLAATSVALGLGIDLAAVVEAAATVEPPPGRLQRIQQGQPFEVVVDFAHTPQALETTLQALRDLAPPSSVLSPQSSVLLVFGMAGGRDAANRPRMGQIAAQHATFFVVSMDDPMGEDPSQIAAEVAEGARSAGAVEGRDFLVELDRRAAIEQVLRRAQPGDVVLLVGKGHEQRMLVGGRAEPWNDADAARQILATLGYPPSTRSELSP